MINFDDFEDIENFLNFLITTMTLTFANAICSTHRKIAQKIKEFEGKKWISDFFFHQQKFGRADGISKIQQKSDGLSNLIS